MEDFMFKELSEVMQAIKAADEKLTPEERNRNYAYNGLDELASICALLKEMPEYIDSLLANPLLDKESEGIIYRLYSAISDFWKTGSSYVESNLAHYIDDEEEDIYG